MLLYMLTMHMNTAYTHYYNSCINSVFTIKHFNRYTEHQTNHKYKYLQQILQGFLYCYDLQCTLFAQALFCTHFPRNPELFLVAQTIENKINCLNENITRFVLNQQWHGFSEYKWITYNIIWVSGGGGRRCLLRATMISIYLLSSSCTFYSMAESFQLWTLPKSGW